MASSVGLCVNVCADRYNSIMFGRTAANEGLNKMNANWTLKTMNASVAMKRSNDACAAMSKNECLSEPKARYATRTLALFALRLKQYVHAARCCVRESEGRAEFWCVGVHSDPARRRGSSRSKRSGWRGGCHALSSLFRSSALGSSVGASGGSAR